MAIFEIINATDYYNNIIRIVCLFELRVPIYQNQTIFPPPYFWNEAGDPQFLLVRFFAVFWKTTADWSAWLKTDQAGNNYDG